MDHSTPTDSTTRSGHSAIQVGIGVGANRGGERIQITLEILSTRRPVELCIQPRTENMRTCPYNSTHCVLESCLSNHISQCRQDVLMCQTEEGKEVIMLPCMHNPTHQVPVQELKQHQEVCPNNVETDLLQEGDNAAGDQAAVLSRKDVDSGVEPTQGNDDHFLNVLSAVEDELRNFQIQSLATDTDIVSVDCLPQELVQTFEFCPPNSPVVEQYYVQCARRNRRIRKPPIQANLDESNGLQTQHQWEMNSSESIDDSLDGEDTWPTQWDHPSNLDPSWQLAWYRDSRADYYYDYDY